MQKSIRPKTKKLAISTRVWTTAIFRYRQNQLVFHARTDNAQKDTSESIGNSCKNSHKSKGRRRESTKVEQKWKCVKSIGFSCINWKVNILKKIWSLQGRRVVERNLGRNDIILYKYYYNRLIEQPLGVLFPPFVVLRQYLPSPSIPRPDGQNSLVIPLFPSHLEPLPRDAFLPGLKVVARYGRLHSKILIEPLDA